MYLLNLIAFVMKIEPTFPQNKLWKSFKFFRNRLRTSLCKSLASKEHSGHSSSKNRLVATVTARGRSVLGWHRRLCETPKPTWTKRNSGRGRSLSTDKQTLAVKGGPRSRAKRCAQGRNVQTRKVDPFPHSIHLSTPRRLFSVFH